LDDPIADLAPRVVGVSRLWLAGDRRGARAGLGLLGRWSRGRLESEQRGIEFDGALVGAFGEVDDRGEGVARFAVVGHDFEAVVLILAMGVDGDAFFGVLAVEKGDAVAAGDRGDATEGVVLERVGSGWRAFQLRRLRGEGRIRPQGGVFRQWSLGRVGESNDG
jgi:hypothetical protein